MTEAIKVGDRVLHYMHGSGVVERLLSQGLAEVRFGGTLAYVEQKNLQSLDKIERETRKNREQERKAREGALKNKVLSLLEGFNYAGAHYLYQEQCRDWWSLNGYNTLVSQAKEKQAIQAAEELLRKQAEERHAAMLREIHCRFESDFLGADTYFDLMCEGIVTEQEYEAEKFNFVSNWIEVITPIKNGSKQLPDKEQISAIAAVNGHVQVVARAGSGKTTTLVNRALFLLKHCRIAPTEILILAFNRKAALEVRRRLLVLIEQGADSAISVEVDCRIKDTGNKNRINWDEIEAVAVDTVAARLNITLPHVMTFHALAYAIVHPEESLLYNGAEGESQGLSRAFQQVIDDHLQQPAFRGKFRELMLAHFREDWDRIVEGRHDQSKDEFLRFRRSLPRESISGDYVKSYGEKIIADFFLSTTLRTGTSAITGGVGSTTDQISLSLLLQRAASSLSTTDLKANLTMTKCQRINEPTGSPRQAGI